VVLRAEPSEAAADFKRRVLAEGLGLPPTSPAKLIYAGQGKQVAGLKTLTQCGVGHRTGLQLELPDDILLAGKHLEGHARSPGGRDQGPAAAPPGAPKAPSPAPAAAAAGGEGWESGDGFSEFGSSSRFDAFSNFADSGGGSFEQI